MVLILYSQSATPYLIEKIDPNFKHAKGNEGKCASIDTIVTLPHLVRSSPPVRCGTSSVVLPSMAETAAARGNCMVYVPRMDGLGLEEVRYDGCRCTEGLIAPVVDSPSRLQRHLKLVNDDPCLSGPAAVT